MNVLRSGGFAGLTTGWELRVDEQPDPAGWLSLVDACPWDAPDQSGAGNDRYIWEFRVGTRRATVGEAFVQGPWRELAEKVQEDGHRIPAATMSRTRRSA